VLGLGTTILSEDILSEEPIDLRDDVERGAVLVSVIELGDTG